MKKLVVVIMLITLCTFVGCHQFSHSKEYDNYSNSLVDTVENIESTEINQNVARNEPSDQTISVRSLDELNKMRKMILCNDEDTLRTYFQSIEGGSVNSKDDLIKFLSLIDSLPYLELIEGKIVWISYDKGVSEDTGTPYEFAYISSEASNGEWIRFEYNLSETDVSAKLKEEKTVLSDPIRYADGMLTLYSKSTKNLSDRKGDIIRWVADIDGVLTNIVYYTLDEADVEKVFNNIDIVHFSDELSH